MTRWTKSTDATCTVCGEDGDVKAGIPYIWNDEIYADEVCKDCRGCPDCGQDYTNVKESYSVTRGVTVSRECKCGYEEWTANPF